MTEGAAVCGGGVTVAEGERCSGCTGAVRTVDARTVSTPGSGATYAVDGSEPASGALGEGAGLPACGWFAARNGRTGTASSVGAGRGIAGVAATPTEGLLAAEVRSEPEAGFSRRVHLK